MSAFQISQNSAFKPMQTKPMPFINNITSRVIPFIETNSFIFPKQINLLPTTQNEIGYLSYSN